MIQSNLTREKAAILGYLHSDGFSRNTKKSSGSLRYEVGFVNKNPDLIRHFELLIKKIFITKRFSSINRGKGIDRSIRGAHPFTGG